MWTDNDNDNEGSDGMPKHGPGRYVRNDPSGGGQRNFWLLLILAAVAAAGVVILWQVYVR